MKKQLTAIFLILMFGLSKALAQVPSITSFSTESEPVGTSVINTGTNFDVSPIGSNIVYFGGVQAGVDSVTNSYSASWSNLSNMQGQEIYSEEAEHVNGTLNKKITLDKLPVEIYFIKVESGNEI